MSDLATTLHETWVQQEEEQGYSDIDYDALIKTMSVEVVSCETFGSYQGDLVYRVRRDGRDGILIIGYGSCSGCDALEAAKPYTSTGPPDWGDVVALRDQLEAGILWPTDGSMVKRVEERAQDEWWEYEDDAMRRYVRKLAREIDGA